MYIMCQFSSSMGIFQVGPINTSSPSGLSDSSNCSICQASARVVDSVWVRQSEPDVRDRVLIFVVRGTSTFIEFQGSALYSSSSCQFRPLFPGSLHDQEPGRDQYQGQPAVPPPPPVNRSAATRNLCLSVEAPGCLPTSKKSSHFMDAPGALGS